MKWLRFLPVALRNEALSRSKKHDGGSSEFWQVYFHRSGDGDGTRCPRTVRAFTEVSPRRHQIAPFDAFPTISIATFSAGGPWHRLAQRPFRKPAIQACHRKPDFPSRVCLKTHRSATRDRVFRATCGWQIKSFSIVRLQNCLIQCGNSLGTAFTFNRFRPGLHFCTACMNKCNTKKFHNAAPSSRRILKVSFTSLIWLL